MNRTLIGVLSLTSIGVVIVAVVHAQESAEDTRQTKSVLVAPNRQPSTSRRGRQLSERLKQSRDQIAEQYAESAGEPSKSDFPAAEVTAAETDNLAEQAPSPREQVTQEPPLLSPPPVSRSVDLPSQSSIQVPAATTGRSVRMSLNDAISNTASTLADQQPLPDARQGRPRTAVLTGQTPAMLVKAEGPSEIHVGQTASYRIDVANHAGESIEDFYVRLVLPEWVQLEVSKASHGDLRRQDISDGSQVLIWKMPQMESQAKEHWLVKIIPQQNKPFDLNVDWWVRPRTLQAGIRVVKPELQLSVRGPSEMTFGQSQMFTLSVTNPGNGDADNVSVTLTPGADKPTWIGRIPAGGSRQLQVELTAAQAGMMQLRAVASADRKLHAEIEHTVTVRQPRLDVKVTGPAKKYAGSLVKYQVVLTNEGDAPANEILIRAGLPNGVTLIPGEGQVDPATGTMAWQLGTLAANAERKFEFTCRLVTAGEKVVQVSAESDLTNMVSSTAMTDVTGVADLKLIVNDPQGPQMVGEEVAYEVQILNRGSKVAEQIQLVTQFSDHIEPVRVTGGRAEIVPGQALFRSLQRLQPGEHVTVKVFAKASVVGNHRFRAELTSQDPETQLVQEEMTRFLVDPNEPDLKGNADD